MTIAAGLRNWCQAGGEHNYVAGPSGVVCCTRCGAYPMGQGAVSWMTGTGASPWNPQSDSSTYTGPGLTSYNASKEGNDE